MAKVPSGILTLPKISIARVGRTNVRDGHTLTYSEREPSTFAKTKQVY